ncbi:hypothetical protein DMC47_01350 [Nostoc sp. 3335mG]|nr:hypothetical protein DMC47_01350 [Nostoc sp. 3335mG]
MSDATAKPAAPLDEVMLAMDVVDTLRHRQDLVARELDGAAREAQLIEKLRDVYRQQGIEVPDHILRQGVDALAQSRFAYAPPAPGFGTTLARLYVSRKRWGRPVMMLVGAALVLGIGYFGVVRPFQEGQAHQEQVQLTEGLPAQMDALRQTIFEETKVQQAVIEADALVKRGKAFAEEGNKPGAETIVAELTALRDKLRQEYIVRVVNRSGISSVIWTFPEINTDATNYYAIVEAVGPDGNVLSLPITNEETGEVETVSIWGQRIPESLYNAIAADRRDDGIIQANEMGRKSDGFLEVEYQMPVLDGAITQW